MKKVQTKDVREVLNYDGKIIVDEYNLSEVLLLLKIFGVLFFLEKEYKKLLFSLIVLLFLFLSVFKYIFDLFKWVIGGNTLKFLNPDKDLFEVVSVWILEEKEDWSFLSDVEKFIFLLFINI